jgi:hypothetical protein
MFSSVLGRSFLASLCVPLGASLLACGGADAASTGDDQDVTARACLFGAAAGDVDRSTALQAAKATTLGAASKLSEISKKQLLAGSGAPTPSVLFAEADRGEVARRAIVEVTSGRRFYEYRYAVKGNERGFYFEAGKAEAPVARLDGGRMKSCSMKASPTRPATTCLFGLTTDELFASPDVTIADPVPVSLKSSLTEVQKKQILVGGKATTLEDSFKVPDGGEYDLYRVVDKRSGRVFSMYGYAQGGDPFAFIFAEQSPDLAARITQDIVEGCVVER